MRQMRGSQSGFTLLELIIVIAVVIMLLAIALILFFNR